jgi:hypothetical protein
VNLGVVPTSLGDDVILGALLDCPREHGQVEVFKEFLSAYELAKQATTRAFERNDNLKIDALQFQLFVRHKGHRKWKDL